MPPAAPVTIATTPLTSTVCRRGQRVRINKRHRTPCATTMQGTMQWRGWLPSPDMLLCELREWYIGCAPYMWGGGGGPPGPLPAGGSGGSGPPPIPGGMGCIPSELRLLKAGCGWGSIGGPCGCAGNGRWWGWGPGGPSSRGEGSPADIPRLGLGWPCSSRCMCE
jgi:hypothetical protein